jgi:hypothetical protein
VKEVQDLEPRCLLSATSDPSQSPLQQACETNVIADPALVQLNGVNLLDVTSLSPPQKNQLISVPFWMPSGVEANGNAQTPTEDLYDEGAGAVWGSLSDEGGPIILPNVQVDAGGIIGIDFGGYVVGDMPPYQPVDFGGIISIDFSGDVAAAGDTGAYGTLGNAVGEVDYVPADYGNGYMGVDDVGEDYNATGGVGYEPADYGGAVWCTIADEGIYGGVDDVADYGAAAIGGLDDVADYGAVIGAPVDGGIDSGIGINGIDGDYGAAANGPGDYGVGADDYGIGAGAYGTNDTGAIGSPAGDYGAVDYGAGAYGAGDYGIGAGDYGTNDTGTIGAVDGDYGVGAGDVDGMNIGAAADFGVDDTINLEILDSEASERHPANQPNGATFRSNLFSATLKINRV